MEALSVVTLMKFKNTIERILHVKGNYQGGILEMTLVADANLSIEQRKNLIPQLLKALKQQGEVFRNVRFNYGEWQQDGSVSNKVCPMMLAMTENFYEKDETLEKETEQAKPKNISGLIDYLKMFHARSKIIILVTDGGFQVDNPSHVTRQMQPFLDKKLVVAVAKGNEVQIKYRESLGKE